MIIPSFYMAYNLLKEKKMNKKIENYISNEFINKGFTLIYKKVNLETKPSKIELAFLNQKLKKEEITKLNLKLQKYDIYNTKLIIKQETKDLKKEILNEIGSRNKILSEKDIFINNLQLELDQFKFDEEDIYREIKILFPNLTNISMGKHFVNQNTDSSKYVTYFLYESSKNDEKEDETKLELWLKLKLKTKELKTINLNKFK
jgi:hypothetical protein